VLHVFPPPFPGLAFWFLRQTHYIIDTTRSNQFDSIWTVVDPTLDTIPRWEEMIKGLNEIIMTMQEVDDSLHNTFGINEIAFEVRHDIEELTVELGMTCFESVKVSVSIDQVWWLTLTLGGLKRHWKWIFRSLFAFDGPGCWQFLRSRVPRRTYGEDKSTRISALLCSCMIRQGFAPLDGRIRCKPSRRPLLRAGVSHA
jgi:hypothetical protein